MGKRIFLAAIAFMVSALSIGTNIKTADAENGKTYPVRVAEQMDNVTGQCVLYGAAEDAVPRDEIWVMYNALSDDDKAVYNLFFDLAVQQKGERPSLTLGRAESSSSLRQPWLRWCRDLRWRPRQLGRGSRSLVRG